MANTKKSSKSTKTTSKRKPAKRKSNVKKGKVYIAPYKIIVLCAVIIIICMALLLATTLASSPKAKDTKSTTLIESFEKSGSKTEQNQKDTKKADTGSQKPKQEEVKKVDAPKTATVKKSTTDKTTAEKSSAKTDTKTETKPKETQKTQSKQDATAAKSTTGATKTADTATAKKNAPTTTKQTAPATTKPAPVTAPAESKKNPETPKQPGKPVNETKPAQNSQNSQSAQNAAASQKPAEAKSESKKDFGFPQAKNGAQLIFVFDDGGQNLSHLDKFLTLPFPITIAVLPQLAHSTESAARVRKSGNEVILHQPMQSVNPKVNPGPGAITPDMSEEQIKSLLFQNINQIAPIAGLNNHEGSAITADADKMAVILQYSTEQGIYFLDSRTNVETKVPYVAGEMGYSYYERNIFLDNEKTRENTLKELNKGLALANKNGSVIMIGHVWSADYLPALLQEIYPELKAKGYTFSVVSKSKAKK